MLSPHVVQCGTSSAFYLPYFPPTYHPAANPPPTTMVLRKRHPDATADPRDNGEDDGPTVAPVPRPRNVARDRASSPASPWIEANGDTPLDEGASRMALCPAAWAEPQTTLITGGRSPTHQSNRITALCEFRKIYSHKQERFGRAFVTIGPCASVSSQSRANTTTSLCMIEGTSSSCHCAPAPSISS